MKTKEFYCVICDKPDFIVGYKTFDRGPLPILWRHKGIYGVIPAAIIANIIQTLIDLEKAGIFDVVEVKKDLSLSDLYGTTYRFRWSQTMKIRSKIGEQLFNEQFNNQTDSNKS